MLHADYEEVSDGLLKMRWLYNHHAPMFPVLCLPISGVGWPSFQTRLGTGTWGVEVSTLGITAQSAKVGGRNLHFPEALLPGCL